MNERVSIHHCGNKISLHLEFTQNLTKISEGRPLLVGVAVAQGLERAVQEREG